MRQRRKELSGNKLSGGELLLSLLSDREGESYLFVRQERFLLGVTLFVRQRNRE